MNKLISRQASILKYTNQLIHNTMFKHPSHYIQCSNTPHTTSPYTTGNHLSFSHNLSYNKHLSHSHQSHSHLSHSHLSHSYQSHSYQSHNHLSQNHHPFLSTQPSVAQCSTTAQATLNHVSHNDQPFLTQHSTLYHTTFDPLSHSYQCH